MLNKLKTLSVESDIRRQLTKKLDPDVIKTKPDKDNTKYISGSTCIDILNTIFGHAWSYDIPEQWVEPGIAFFKKDNDYWKAPSNVASINSEGLRGALLEQNPTMWVKAVLTVYLYEENLNKIIEIRKTAFGSTPLTGTQQVQAKNGYKGAQTDALKKAASLFGIANELYRDSAEKKWFDVYFQRTLPLTLTDEVKNKFNEDIEEINKLLNEFTDPKTACEYYVSQITQGYTNNFEKIPLDCLKPLLDLLKSETGK